MTEIKTGLSVIEGSWRACFFVRVGGGLLKISKK